MRRVPNVVVFLASIFLAMSVSAEPDVPKTELEKLRELAQERSSKDLRDLNREERLLDGSVWEQFERIGKRKFIHCMKAFPHEQYCQCLVDSIPVDFGMDAYLKIMTSSREEIGYSNMTDDARNAVDATIQARELCVSKNL